MESSQQFFANKKKAGMVKIVIAPEGAEDIEKLPPVSGDNKYGQVISQRWIAKGCSGH
jgi:hypothetical protein